MDSHSDDSTTWYKPRLPSSSLSYGISKAVSARLDLFDTHSSHLSLLNRLMRVIRVRAIPEVLFSESNTSAILLGRGATFKVEKRYFLHEEDSIKRLQWVATKRAEVIVPKQFTAGLSVNDAAYRRLKAVLLELEVLSHPRIRRHHNIAQLIGFSWDETASGYAPIIVMELATFGDGRKFLSSTKLSDEERVAFCGDIASGLQAIHTCSIVHGDVKLENILVYPGTSSRFIAKISDFERSPQVGDEYLYRGTKIYNAPEVQNAHRSNQALCITSSQLRLCDAFSFGLLTLEVLSSARWYGDIPGGHMLEEQVLNGGTEADAVLKMGLELAETSLRPSPILRAVCHDVLRYTLPPMSNRLSGGWSLVLDILKRYKEVTDEEHIRSPTEMLPEIDSGAQYSMLEFCAELKIEQDALGQAMWGELEWTASYDVQPLRKGKAAFGLFILYSLGRYSPDISLQGALDYITSAALSGFGPAFVIGKRLFLANDLPVPDSIQKGPQDTELRRHIEFLDGLPNEKYYSAAIRIFWSAHVRNRGIELMSKTCAICHNRSETGFMEWIHGLNKDLGCGAFKIFAMQNFLLHQAIAESCSLAVDFLLRLGCDINAQTPDGITPLHLACRFTDLKIINLLVEGGANASLHASDNTLPLHWLVLLDDNQVRPVAEALLKNGAAVNPLNGAKAYFDDLGLQLDGSPFQWACRCRNHGVIQALLDLGAKPSQVKDIHGYRPIIQMGFLDVPLAIVAPEIIEVLLRHHDLYFHLTSDQKEAIFSCIGVQKSNDFQRWTMHGGFYGSAYRRTIETLYSYDVCLPLTPRSTLEDTGLYPPLIRAAMSHNLHSMKELLQLGANVNDRDHYTGSNALEIALLNSEIINSPRRIYKAVELLLQHGATTRSGLGPLARRLTILPETESLTSNDVYEKTAIHTACRCYASASLIRLLATASPGEVNKKSGGITPLHQACCHNDEGALSKAQALVESGADLHIEADHYPQRTGCCWTALAKSLFALNWPVAKYLLDQGSSTVFGNSRGHQTSVHHLMIYMAVKFEARNRPGELAALYSTIKHLLDHPVCRQEDLLNEVNFLGHSPMRMAIYFGLPRLLKVLLNNRYGRCNDFDDIAEGNDSVTEYVDGIFISPEDLLPWTVQDDSEVDLDESLDFPKVKISVFRKRVEDVKEILESKLNGSSENPLPLASF